MEKNRLMALLEIMTYLNKWISSVVISVSDFRRLRKGSALSAFKELNSKFSLNKQLVAPGFICCQFSLIF